MALIDVSDLMSDPDFADEFTVRRCVQTMNETGRPGVTFTDIPAIGSVQSSDGATLDVQPEGSRSVEMIAVFTTFPLREVSAGFEADRIVWRGREYRVTKVRDYTNFGGGHVEATAVLLGTL